jgi:uncharacterized protein (DUF3084 family)
MKNIKTIIIAVLAGVTAFSVYKYIVSVNENNILAVNIRQLNEDVRGLENEKNGLTKDLEREKEINTALTQDNAGLKENLTQNMVQLTQLEADFQASRKVLENLNSEFSLVKAENSALRDQVQGLQMEISQAKVDKEEMQLRLSSIEELKKAIKELRQKARQVKRHVDQRIVAKEKIAAGNNGFLVKDGKSMLIGTIKIEVEPLPGS